MSLSYRDLDYGSLHDCELLSTWNNDPALKHLSNRFLDQNGLETTIPVSYFQSLSKLNKGPSTSRDIMIHFNGVPVGAAYYEIDPTKLSVDRLNTGWVALVIGDKTLWRQGLGTQVVGYLERCLLEQGVRQVEVGVFEYNLRSLRFFKRLGYREVEVLEERAYFDGRMWKEFRLLKDSLP